MRQERQKVSLTYLALSCEGQEQDAEDVRSWQVGETKGIATIRLNDGTISTAELHWYEEHGIGRQEIKIKRFVR